MKYYCAYTHSKPDGTPFYVGKANNVRRPHSMKRNSWHDRIVAKYGAENIKVDIIPVHSDQMALNAEIWLIRIARKMGVTLTNMTDGGDGISGLKRSEETKKKISNATKGRVVSNYTRGLVSKSAKKRVVSDATREKMSASRMGRKISESHRQALLISNIGRKCSDRCRDAVALSNKIRIPSEKQRIAVSLSNANRVKKNTQ